MKLLKPISQDINNKNKKDSPPIMYNLLLVNEYSDKYKIIVTNINNISAALLLLKYRPNNEAVTPK